MSCRSKPGENTVTCVSPDSYFLSPCLRLPLEEQLLNDISEKAIDWALMHGACMRSKTNLNKDVLQFAPFLLLPSVFPRKEFEKAVAMQPLINELMHKVAHDRDFLTQALSSVLEVDPFTGRLFKLYETVMSEGVSQPISLGLVRSDLMLETGRGNCCISDSCPPGTVCAPYCCWKQVEFNTIASGFGWLGPASGHIHRYVLSELGHGNKIGHIPDNNALESLCNGMLQAWEIYCKDSGPTPSHHENHIPEKVESSGSEAVANYSERKKPVILFVIEDVTYNICDQKFHEFEIRRQNPDVFVIRRTLTQINGQGHMTAADKKLVVDGNEVAVVYFRCGYSPDQYPSEKEWNARLMIERSKAIKCPSIHYHLAGTKKVQQMLAKSGSLERFVQNDKTKATIRQAFTGLYALDFDKDGEDAIDMAIANPEMYVLKPQREGGGNNIYGTDVRDKLIEMRNSRERTGWILMDKINPPFQKNYVVRPGADQRSKFSDFVSELGIFGVVIGDAENILVNKEAGYMLRTKLSNANEGGVAAGLGALDSPFLLDIERKCLNCCNN